MESKDGDGDSTAGELVECHRTHHDWTEDTTVSTSIVQAIATVTDTPATAVDPLYETIDPDALDQLLSSMRTDGRGHIQFIHQEVEVTVDASGVIELRYPAH